jgi:hypothetical protein
MPLREGGVDTMLCFCCAALAAGLVLSASNAGAETPRDVSVDPHGPPGGQEGRFPYNFEPYYEPPHEVWIAHNTLVGNGQASIFVDSGSQPMILRNILVGSDQAQPAIVFAPGGVARQIEQNLYWQARPPLLREYEGGEYERVADPLFADAQHGDFRVSDGSPARTVRPVGDALSFVLSPQPAGFELGPQIGANLGRPASPAAEGASDAQPQ